MDAYVEYKHLEGARIQPLLGAVSALPGAALVLGSGADAGAPLFVTALTLIAASYLFWMCSDAIFAVQYDHASAGNAAEADRLEKLGYHFSWGTLLMGLLRLAAQLRGSLRSIPA